MNNCVQLIALARLLIGKKKDDLTDLEQGAFNLCRDEGLLFIDFGPEGEDDGVIRHCFTGSK